MSQMSHMRAASDLFALLRRGPPDEDPDGDLAIASEEPPPSCDDADAFHDIAALQDGNLSRAGVRRLADHLGQCRSCRILVALLVAESTRADSTATHSASKSP
jgi:hypothetical protein